MHLDLQTWMVEARDVDQWGARVEDKLGLQPDSFRISEERVSKIGNCFNFLCEGTDAIARHPVSKVFAFAFEAAKE